MLTNTTALQTGTSAKCAINMNAIHEILLYITPESIKDPIRTVRYNIGSSRFTKLEISGGGTTAFQAGTTAVQRGATVRLGETKITNSYLQMYVREV